MSFSQAMIGYFTIQPRDDNGLFLNYETHRFDKIFEVSRHAFITNFEAQQVAKEIAQRDRTVLRVVLRHKNHTPYGEYLIDSQGLVTKKSA